MEITLLLYFYFLCVLTTVELNAPHLLNTGLSCGIEWSVETHRKTGFPAHNVNHSHFPFDTFHPLLYPDFKTTLIRMTVAEHPEFLGN